MDRSPTRLTCLVALPRWRHRFESRWGCKVAWTRLAVKVKGKVKAKMAHDPRTTQYIDRRMKEGRTKKEAVRCLKRNVAREVYGLLPHGKLGVYSP
jgi:hypothetical protein